MRQRIGPSGIFATYTRAHVLGVTQVVASAAPPGNVISFAGGTLTEALRFVIDGDGVRYIGNPRILVGITAFASFLNTAVGASASNFLIITVNDVAIINGPPVGSNGTATDLAKTVNAGIITSLITNDLIGLRLAGSAATMQVNIPQLIISPIGDGESP